MEAKHEADQILSCDSSFVFFWTMPDGVHVNTVTDMVSNDVDY